MSSLETKEAARDANAAASNYTPIVTVLSARARDAQDLLQPALALHGLTGADPFSALSMRFRDNYDFSQIEVDAQCIAFGAYDVEDCARQNNLRGVELSLHGIRWHLLRSIAAFKSIVARHDDAEAALKAGEAA